VSRTVLGGTGDKEGGNNKRVVLQKHPENEGRKVMALLKNGWGPKNFSSKPAVFTRLITNQEPLHNERLEGGNSAMGSYEGPSTENENYLLMDYSSTSWNEGKKSLDEFWDGRTGVKS